MRIMPDQVTVGPDRAPDTSTAIADVRILRMNTDLSYPQIGAAEHVPALSAIDALMHCSPEELRALLGQYQLLEAAQIARSTPAHG